MILRFGCVSFSHSKQPTRDVLKAKRVEPNLQPPSPNPPSTTLRGLYLLACIIISFFGAAIGIFFFNLAKYFVSAAGGFAFGWFLLATRHGGLVPSVIGRWFLLGGLTVAAFVASLPKVLEPHMILVSTAWIGATAFTLGVDCFTRGGLKEVSIERFSNFLSQVTRPHMHPPQRTFWPSTIPYSKQPSPSALGRDSAKVTTPFTNSALVGKPENCSRSELTWQFYVYNLGFHDLFPSLNGLRYPLTQTMEIELGILAAMVIVRPRSSMRVFC